MWGFGLVGEHSLVFIPHVALLGLLGFWEVPVHIVYGEQLPVVQIFSLKQATGVHLVQKVVHLVAVGDSDPMVFALNLSPFQLARKGGDMRFWSVAPWREEVVFDSQLLLGGNNIPHA